MLANAPHLILPLLVLNLLGTEMNAYFYIAWMIAAVLYSIPGAVSESLFAESSFDLTMVKKNVGLSLKLILFLAIPAVAIICIAGKWILHIFGQSYSANALLLLWLLSGTVLFKSIINVYISLLRVVNRIFEIIVIEGVFAASVLIACYLILPSAGINGIGYIWLAVHCLLAVVLFFRLRYLLVDIEKKTV